MGQILDSRRSDIGTDCTQVGNCMVADSMPYNSWTLRIVQIVELNRMNSHFLHIRLVCSMESVGEEV
jgi:hypothetical protein